MEKMIIENNITLSIGKEKVWNALFDNKYVLKYMGCEIRKIGSDKLEWIKKTNDYEEILLYGDIIESKPYNTLKIQTFNPHRHYHSKFLLDVTYQINKNKNKTELKITQTGFERLPDGETVFGENKVGWNTSLSKLKEILDNE
jgi:uncharacterized protein YndB with AHSA1/START domain